MTRTLPRPRRRARAGALLCALALLVGVQVTPTADAVVKPRVRWSAVDAVTGAKVTATVRSDSWPRGTRLVLQRKDLDHWRTVDGTARGTSAGYVLRVPTGQLGRFAVRVAARDGGAVRSASTAQDVRVRPTYDPGGRRSDHTFLGDRRFRWDPCRPLRWAFNPAHSPRHALRQVKGTIKLARQATGLPFEYVGRTDVVPTLRPHKGDFQIIVGWRTPRSFGYFGNHPGRVGVGGASWHTGFREADGTRVNRAWSGRLILNARYNDLKNGYGRGYTWGDVLLHEFGHVLGLGHARNRSQQMFPEMTRHKARWGAGDLAGLRWLGSGRGCLTRVDARTHGHARSATSRH